MDLMARYPAKCLPEDPFIGLFGNHHNNWRDFVKTLLVKNGVDNDFVYDSTDKGWEIVGDQNGDALQDWIDELVMRQHKAMREAKCLIFSLDSLDRSWPEQPVEDFKLPDRETDFERTLFVARWELGWLTGIEKPTFVWISDELQGRNYLRAAIKSYDWIKTYPSLVKATLAAAAFFNK